MELLGEKNISKQRTKMSIRIRMLKEIAAKPFGLAASPARHKLRTAAVFPHSDLKTKTAQTT